MNNSLNTMSVAEVESTASTVEPTKKVDGAAGQMRQPEYQSPVVEIPMSGQRIHRTSPKLEAAAGQKARRADGYCRVIILRGSWSTPPHAPVALFPQESTSLWPKTTSNQR
jgi:hypothetical protein